MRNAVEMPITAGTSLSMYVEQYMFSNILRFYCF